MEVDGFGNQNPDAKDFTGETAMMFAAAGGHLQTVEFLLQKGAQINRESKYCMTPLIAAAGCGHIPVIIQFILLLVFHS